MPPGRSPTARGPRSREEAHGLMELLSACLVAFVSVFVLLSFLAVIMHWITLAFPSRREGVDPVIVAAISGTVASLIPGARITHIEEEKS